MESARWWAQPFRPEGDNTGSGIKNQLGRPNLGEYAVLVREACQNSWDARKSDNEVVKVKFTIRKLGKDAAFWRKVLGSSKLPGHQGKKLGALDEDSYILIVGDRSTVGLGGPIRSDESRRKGQTANFIQFIRNVGEARDTELGGGTYGFGKGIFYRVSHAAAILVDTRNLEAGSTGRRLIGAALSDAFDDNDGRRYTGRHWWGNIVGDVPDPLMGEQASLMSSRLGLPGFNDGETGTDIVIILPNLSLESSSETAMTLAERIRGHIYWNLWPKFHTKVRSQKMHFVVEVDGESLDFPPISNVPVLRDFARALDNLDARKGTDYSLKKYGYPLGGLSTEWVISHPHSAVDETSDSIFTYSPITSPYRHVARMRSAELVVDYQTYAQLPSPDVGYAGVFRATPFSDNEFAEAEPPTHDDWSTAGLTGSALGIVRGAASFIREQTEALVNARSGARSKTVQGLGRLSNTLGSFVQGAPGNRGRKKPKKGNRTTGGSKKVAQPRVFRVLDPSRVRVVDGLPVVELTLEVLAFGRSDFSLEATGNVLLATGGLESQNNGPLGSMPIEFLGWYDADGNHVGASKLLGSDDLRPGTWTVRFKHLPNAALKISVRKVSS